MRKGGCWIFLSHSSKDIEKVRQIRNEFEKRGHNPLAFHLLCLSNETKEKKAELDGLIKREIDAREWFVYCNSDSANASEYVKMERDYISDKNKEMKWTLDLSKPMDELIKEIDKICIELKVFLSYAHKDQEMVDMLSNELLKLDLSVWQTGDILDDDWGDSIKDAIKYNFSVAIITENYLKSRWCLLELIEITKSGKHFMPIIVGDADIPNEIKGINCYKIPAMPKESDMHFIAELIRNGIKREL